MSEKLCTACGYAPRWTGPQGTNPKLTMCEQCQRRYWREHKTARRGTETTRTCTACGQTFPLTEAHFYYRPERGTFRRQCKSCYGSHVGTRKRQTASSGQKRSRSKAAGRAAPAAQTVKVLVVDRTRNRIYRFSAPITDPGKTLADVRDLARLIEFFKYTGHVVVEI